MVLKRRTTPADPDTLALKSMGKAVCARLDRDPAAYRLPVEGLAIYGVGGFLSTSECARLIEMVDAVAVPSPTYHGNSDNGRTSFTGDVDPAAPFIRMLQRRIDDLLGIEPACGETLQGQRYALGQQFRAHFDHFDPSAAYWPGEQARGGQRSWTAMAYLSDVEEGGSTDFPKLGLSVAPQAGALLVWNNMTESGTPNPLSLHAGTPVVKGMKYVVTKWYRARPWT
jgi:prolyl 4-hydroxylase